MNYNHLDKNFAPRANEAMTKVNKAKEVLMNPGTFQNVIDDNAHDFANERVKDPNDDVFWAGEVPKNRQKSQKKSNQNTDAVKK